MVSIVAFVVMLFIAWQVRKVEVEKIHKQAYDLAYEYARRYVEDIDFNSNVTSDIWNAYWKHVAENYSPLRQMVWQLNKWTFDQFYPDLRKKLAEIDTVNRLLL